MGSEILDSGGWVGALPTPGFQAPLAPLAPALELELLSLHEYADMGRGRADVDDIEHLDDFDDLAPGRDAGDVGDLRILGRRREPGTAGLREVAASVAAATRRIATDPGRRRIAVRVVAACLSLMIVTGWIVHAHDQRIADAQQAAALNVDIRLAQVPADTSSGDGQLPALEGSASAEVQLHNVGPLPVHLLGLDVLAGFEDDASYPVLRTDTTVQPGDQLDQSYHVTLPCGIDRGAAAAGTMNAQIRTSDGVVHTLPVDLTAVNDAGGLLGACLYYEFRQGQFRGFGS
jgi:hypothetical protein